MKTMLFWFPYFCLFNVLMAFATDAMQTTSAVVGWSVAAALAQRLKQDAQEETK